MITLATLRSERRADILQIAESHGVRNVRVFGSVVSADDREDSDIDFLVDFAPGKTLFDLIGFKLDLEALLATRVDVVTPNSLTYIRDRVLAEAVPL